MHGHWPPGPKPQTHAAAARRRKQRQLEAQLTELGMEALDERLQMATQARLGLLSPQRIAQRHAARCPESLAPAQQAAYWHTLTSAPLVPQAPVNPPYRLARAISECTGQGRAALVVEVVRPTPSSTSLQLAAFAKRAVAAVRRSTLSGAGRHATACPRSRHGHVHLSGGRGAVPACLDARPAWLRARVAARAPAAPTPVLPLPPWVAAGRRRAGGGH